MAFTTVERYKIIEIYMYEDDLQLGELKENCLLLKLYRKLRKMFLSPRRELNPQPSDLHGLLSAI